MWNLSSRVHRLNHFPNDGCVCYVKREDELSCGISGSKLRKYASLLPYLLTQGIRHLVIIAGPQSNNLLAALQLAREFQFNVTAFLLRPWTLELQGNYKLSRLFIEEQDIVWIEREQWPQVNKRASDYLNLLSEPGFVVYEGASVPEAMEGAQTLADDIILNEATLGLKFQHIFMDAGTGFSATALVARLAELSHHAKIHILLLADDEELFHRKLNQWIGLLPNNCCCFYPSTAKAFGSVNQTIKKEVQRMAREEGILADPVYAAKLFYESRKRIQLEQLQGNVLMIHSGGTLSMPAFNYLEKGS